VPWLPRLALGAAVGLAVLLLLWVVLQPGIVLEWSVEGDPALAFRVYRAPVGTADFGLVGEVPAEPQVRRYRYVDALPWLAKAYEYRVEALAAGGQPVLSQATEAGALEALPAQLAVVLLSLLAGLGASFLGGQQRFRALGLAV
jgi:hypothetical protein